MYVLDISCNYLRGNKLASGRTTGHDVSMGGKLFAFAFAKNLSTVYLLGHNAIASKFPH